MALSISAILIVKDSATGKSNQFFLFLLRPTRPFIRPVPTRIKFSFCDSKKKIWHDFQKSTSKFLLTNIQTVV